ncbi:MAG TPA: class I SAM-dependent methyltransferase [Baekduia sp.]|nr:class I SAM-dependent methyltransferase [Baekduia sp.]
MSASIPGRDNFALRTSERWQPPAFVAPTTLAGRLAAWARRLLDLQAASAWNDLKQLLPDAHGDVLDVGSGAQPYRPLLPEDARYRAIDVRIAGEAFGYDMPDTTYFEGDVWPVEDASVDVVLATETLEHVPDPAAFLAEARRVLRPGGRLILTVPFAARWHYIPHDYWRYTPSSLRNLFEAAGLGDVVVHARGNEVTIACYKVMALVLPSVFPPDGGFGPRRLAAFAALPFVGVLALVGQASLRRDGGDDCLGWTATARLAPVSS